MRFFNEKIVNIFMNFFEFSDLVKINNKVIKTETIIKYSENIHKNSKNIINNKK